LIKHPVSSPDYNYRGLSLHGGDGPHGRGYLHNLFSKVLNNIELKIKHRSNSELSTSTKNKFKDLLKSIDENEKQFMDDYDSLKNILKSGYSGIIDENTLHDFRSSKKYKPKQKNDDKVIKLINRLL
jgi:Txe/YoeB family toxin of Txe-Axe toxin-antitoxin module